MKVDRGGSMRPPLFPGLAKQFASGEFMSCGLIKAKDHLTRKRKYTKYAHLRSDRLSSNRYESQAQMFVCASCRGTLDACEHHALAEYARIFSHSHRHHKFPGDLPLGVRSDAHPR